MPDTKLPKIAIVGRPNVGKSSLFNRIAGSRKAIVEFVRGTTRDRLYSNVKWKGRSFTIIDTGGFEESARDDITPLILKANGLIRDESALIKILGNGSIKNAATIQAHAFSKRAALEIVNAGGKAEIINV